MARGQNCRFATRDLNNNKKQQVRCIVPSSVRLHYKSILISFVDVVLTPLHLWVMARYFTLFFLKWNMKWLTQQAVTVRLIYECFVVCRSCYYSIYIVNLLMLLWTCVWLWTLSTPYLIPRAWTLYLTRGNKDILTDWLINALFLQ